MDEEKIIERLDEIEEKLNDMSENAGCLYPMMIFLFMIAMCSPHH